MPLATIDGFADFRKLPLELELAGRLEYSGDASVSLAVPGERE